MGAVERIVGERACQISKVLKKSSGCELSQRQVHHQVAVIRIYRLDVRERIRATGLESAIGRRSLTTNQQGHTEDQNDCRAEKDVYLAARRVWECFGHGILRMRCV